MTGSEPTNDPFHRVDPDVAVTLFAERVDASTRWVATEAVTVARRVVTTTRTVEVTVRREELVVETSRRSPEAASAADLHPEHEPLVILLREEVPEITMRVVPYEQVSVHVERVHTEDQRIDTQLRHDAVEFTQEDSRLEQLPGTTA